MHLRSKSIPGNFGRRHEDTGARRRRGAKMGGLTPTNSWNLNLTAYSSKLGYGQPAPVVFKHVASKCILYNFMAKSTELRELQERVNNARFPLFLQLPIELGVADRDPFQPPNISFSALAQNRVLKNPSPLN